jgi:hypothetical protein
MEHPTLFYAWLVAHVTGKSFAKYGAKELEELDRELEKSGGWEVCVVGASLD